MKRREFLRASLRAGFAVPAARVLSGLCKAEAPAPGAGRPIFPDPARGWHGESSLAAALRAGQVPPLPEGPAVPTPDRGSSLADRLSDPARHFLFEYYPWYASDPFRHWDQFDRIPPLDVASNYLPRLGAYDSRSAALVERHARWIAETGVGGVNLSWWGRGSFEDRLVPLVMDVMRDHDLKVAFHLEPYADDHGLRYADDVLYVLREYGEKRRWDSFLLLEDADGSLGPIFKSFRTILPEQVTDCHGIRQRVSDFTGDEPWRRQTDGVRRALREDFDHVTLLADSLDFERTAAAGFDGVAVYDNFVRPSSYALHAAGASEAGLLFSFNVNPGYDGIEPRRVDPGACYAPTPFEPPSPDADFSGPAGRERAASLAAERIRQSLHATLLAQADLELSNARRGFFLAYVNSFNEWHEGHAFEPMQDADALRPEERAFGYHNPSDGNYRLMTLQALLRRVLEPRGLAGELAYA